MADLLDLGDHAPPVVGEPLVEEQPASAPAPAPKKGPAPAPVDEAPAPPPMEPCEQNGFCGRMTCHGCCSNGQNSGSQTACSKCFFNQCCSCQWKVEGKCVGMSSCQ